ncbi:hypothetical protein ACTA71_000185 [Dictyostelium dimigraforme]
MNTILFGLLVEKVNSSDVINVICFRSYILCFNFGIVGDNGCVIIFIIQEKVHVQIVLVVIEISISCVTSNPQKCSMFQWFLLLPIHTQLYRLWWKPMPSTDRCNPTKCGYDCKSCVLDILFYEKSASKKLKEKEQYEEDEQYEIQQDLGLPEEFDDNQDGDDEMKDNDDGYDSSNKKSGIKQIDQLIILSSDVAKKRNRPIQQNEKLALAPFFLSTIEGLEPKFAKN